MKEQNQDEVSLRVSVTESGLSVGVKSRAISALDRLVGGLGILAAGLERVEARIRNQTYRESIIQKAAADARGTRDSQHTASCQSSGSIKECRTRY